MESIENKGRIEIIEDAIRKIGLDREKINNHVDRLEGEFKKGSSSKYVELGLTAVKFFEVLQKNNEQLIKLIGVMQKESTLIIPGGEEEENLSDDEVEEALREKNGEKNKD